MKKSQKIMFNRFGRRIRKVLTEINKRNPARWVMDYDVRKPSGWTGI